MGQYKSLPPGVTRVATVLHDADHYAVLEIDIPNKKVYVYDGLYRDLNKWLDYVFSAMKHCMLCDLRVAHLYVPAKPKLTTLRRLRHAKMSIEGYQLTLGIHDEWRFERGHFIKQVDSFNCGPIACTKILEMFHLTSDYEVRLMYATNGIRKLVMDNWRRFIHRSEQDLLVRVKEHHPLRTPAAEEGNVVLPPRNTFSTTQNVNPVIAVAAAASALAEINHHQLCFCYCDSPDMELVRLKCCKQTIHQQCVLAHLCIDSQCTYCRGAVLDIAGVLDLTTIDRSEIVSATMSPSQRTPTPKHDLQSLLMDDTPLRLENIVWAELQGEKQESQVSRPKR